MKKLIAITIAMILVFALLASCTGKKDIISGGGENSGAQSGSGASSGSGSSQSAGSADASLDDIDWDEFDGAISQMNEYLQSLGLEEGEYGFTQYGVWNTDLLPSCLPPEPASGISEIDRTEYKDKHHEDLMANLGTGYTVGSIEFPDKNYERHMVMFTCAKQVIVDYVDAMKAAGFEFEIMNQEYSGVTYEWLGQGYYVCLTARGDWDDDDDDFWTYIEATPTLGNPHPRSFNGTPLPDFGLVMYYYEFGGYGANTDGGDWDDTYDFWDIYNDRGDLPDEWSMDYEYGFVTIDQAKAYVQKLASSGWTVTYDHDGEDWSGKDVYTAQLEKGNLFAAVESYSDHYSLRVAFATMGEMLYY